MGGFTSFLATLGKILATGVAIISGVSPALLPFFGAKAASTEGTIVNDLTAIGSVVVDAETFIQAPGSGVQKLAAATPLVASVVKASELVSGHDIADENLFLQGCGKITSGVADVLNSLKPNNIKTSGSPVVVPPAGPTAPPTAS